MYIAWTPTKNQNYTSIVLKSLYFRIVSFLGNQEMIWRRVFKFDSKNVVKKWEALSKLLCLPAKVQEMRMPIFLRIALVERNWEETFLMELTYY